MLERCIIIFSACLLEVAFGYPKWLYRWIRHPVVWMGACITLLDRNFNRPGLPQRRNGILAMGVLLTLTGSISLLIAYSGILAETFCIAALMATRSLYEHVREVYVALEQNNLLVAREKLSRIVGRDVEALDSSGIAHAAIESLAESFSDGVIAPIFWGWLLGLPGIACYKAINTADSMIGHKDKRYLAFGWASARLDDLVNYIPARLSGVLLVLASCSAHAWHIMQRDARKHTSPNAGWPEAAMAGALRLQLGGPRQYDGVETLAPLMGDGTIEATPEHLHRALRLYTMACAMPLLLLAAVWALPWLRAGL